MTTERVSGRGPHLVIDLDALVLHVVALICAALVAHRDHVPAPDQAGQHAVQRTEGRPGMATQLGSKGRSSKKKRRVRHISFHSQALPSLGPSYLQGSATTGLPFWVYKLMLDEQHLHAHPSYTMRPRPWLGNRRSACRCQSSIGTLPPEMRTTSCSMLCRPNSP